MRTQPYRNSRVILLLLLMAAPSAVFAQRIQRQSPSAQKRVPLMCTELGPRPAQMIAPDDPSLTDNSASLSSAGILRCKWDQDVLRVAFLDGDVGTRERVKAVANQWTPFANVKFKFGDDANAEIRITFRSGGYSSYVGNCYGALSGPTMHLQGLSLATPDSEVSRVVLHEFGHALGLIHEHQSRSADIPWDLPKVYAYYAWTNGWSAAMVDQNVIKKEQDPSLNYTAYDPESIMHYRVPNELTIGDFEVPWNTTLSALDRSFIGVWYAKGLWQRWGSGEHGYYAGNWDGFRGANLAVRRQQCLLKDLNYDGIHDLVQCYGNAAGEDEYLIGDWDGDGKDNIGVRKGNCVNMDVNFDGWHDIRQCYGNGSGEDQYLVGDWDGDGRDNLAVRKGNCINMDYNFDAAHDRRQCYGDGSLEDQYLVGDWDGDGKDNLAVRRGNCVSMDHNFDGAHDRQQCYGDGSGEDQYLVGDWDGDGKDNLAVRKKNCVSMDYNFDASHDRRQCYGNG
jgi:hypothetical protein